MEQLKNSTAYAVFNNFGSTINSVGGLKIYFHYFLFKNKKLVTK